MRRQLLLTMLATGLYGLSKFVFNILVVRTAGPSILGEISSFLALIAIVHLALSHPVATTINRYSAEFIAAGKERRAGTLLAYGLVWTITASAAACLVMYLFSASLMERMSISDPFLYNSLLLYAFFYGTYFVFKFAFYGFQRVSTYFITESLAGIVFFLVLFYALLSGRYRLLTIPWVAHTVIFTILAARHFIGKLSFRGTLSSSEQSHRSFIKYALYILATSAAGLGAYHLSILLTDLLLHDSQITGKLALLLSLLAPLGFLPLTVSMVLFPRISSTLGTGTVHTNAPLLRKTTRALVACLGPCLVFILGSAPLILRYTLGAYGLPEILSLQLIACGTVLALISTPSGNFLTATHYAGTSAAIAAWSLAAGLVLWLILIPIYGMIGAALGYCICMVVKSLCNLFLSKRHLEWQAGMTRQSSALLVLGLAGGAIAIWSPGPGSHLAGVITVTFLSLAFVYPVLRELLPEARARDNDTSSATDTRP